MAGYIGSKAVLLSTTAAVVTGDADIGGGLTVDTNTLFVDATNNRVGVGTASPATALHVIGAAVVGTQSGAGVVLGQNENGGEIGLNNTSAAQRGLIDFVDGNNDGNGTLRFLNLSPTDGDVQIGIAAANAVGNINFVTNNAERARIDASGSLMVGRSIPQNGNSRFSFEHNNASDNSLWVHQASTTTGVGTGIFVATTAINSSLDTSGFFYDAASDWPNSFARRFAVRKDGVIFSTSGTISVLSDQRIKENIRDADEGLEVVMSLRPRRFDYVNGKGNGKSNQLGFVAQEAEAVFPEMVDVMYDMKLDGDDEPLKTVGPSALIPVLVKAIQDQQAIIEALEARIVTLEGGAA